jgi:LuxR family transcriptional regulator, quorum-sensing system regulator SdiA
MPKTPPIVAQMSELLERLAAFSDSGFALAIRIRYTSPTLLYRTYPQGWIDHYTENGFMLSDPVVHWGLRQTGMVDWASLINDDPNGVLQSAIAHHLLNGVTYSTGLETCRTISGHTRSSGPFTPAEREEIASLVDAAHALTEGFETLSKAEQEALRTLSQG